MIGEDVTEMLAVLPALLGVRLMAACRQSICRLELSLVGGFTGTNLVH